MTDPNGYWGNGASGTHVSDVNIAAQFLADNTGAVDSGPEQQVALTNLAMGQSALYPKGTYLTATQVVLPPVGVQIRLAQVSRSISSCPRGRKRSRRPLGSTTPER